MNDYYVRERDARKQLLKWYRILFMLPIVSLFLFGMIAFFWIKVNDHWYRNEIAKLWWIDATLVGVAITWAGSSIAILHEVTATYIPALNSQIEEAENERKREQDQNQDHNHLMRAA